MFLNTKNNSKVSPVKQQVFTETKTKRNMDPYFQFLKHEGMNLKYKSSCSYLESVSTLYSIWVIIGSGDGLSPISCEAIAGIDADLSYCQLDP